MAESYGVAAVFFWQPLLDGKVDMAAFGSHLAATY